MCIACNTPPDSNAPQEEDGSYSTKPYTVKAVEYTRGGKQDYSRYIKPVEITVTDSTGHSETHLFIIRSYGGGLAHWPGCKCNKK